MRKVNVIKKKIYIHKDRDSSHAFYTDCKPEKSETGIYCISNANEETYRYFGHGLQELFNLKETSNEVLYEVEITAKVKQLE